MKLKSVLLIASAVAGAMISGCGSSDSSTAAAPTSTRTIVMVWDGLRPDSINPTDTPNLYNLRQSGVNFADNHSTYPTFTMMNGQSFASGSFPGPAAANTSAGTGSGFYGNTYWAGQSDTTLTAGSEDANSSTFIGSATVSVGAGTTLFVEPVFTEDHLILDQLNAYYKTQGDVGLLLVKSLFATAQAAGLKTAAIGKSGAAFIQDFTQSTATSAVFVDENSVRPAKLVKDLIAAGYPLPLNTKNDVQYAGANDPTGTAGGLTTYMSTQFPAAPTYFGGAVTLQTAAYADPVTNAGASLAANDPSDSAQGATEDPSNKYMMHVYKDFILPNATYRPDLTLVWFRTPDNVEHSYGPGSPNALAGLRSQDARLGELITALKDNGLDTTTNIIVVSDHGHSTVSGPVTTFPLIALTPNSSAAVAYTYGPNGAAYPGTTTNTGTALGATTTNTGSFRSTTVATDPTKPATFGNLSTATPGGYSFSGDIRIADLLYYRGLNAYDGSGCSSSFMAGLVAGTTPVLLQKKETSVGQYCNPVVGAANVAVKTYMGISDVPGPSQALGGRANFQLPSKSATYAANFVMSTNQGGSDFIYVPSGNQATVAAVVKSLQQRQEIGAIFVASKYLVSSASPAINGVMPMSAVNLENTTRAGKGQPDIVVSFNWDGTIVSTTSTIDAGTVSHVGQMVQGMPGTTFESFAARHGMHGSMGTTDVHNTLIANGPSFKSGYVDTFPSGNVDVAPTVAYVLGTSMSQAQGRILSEAIVGSVATPTVVSQVLDPSAFGVTKLATGLVHESLTDQTGVKAATVANGDPATLSVGSYSINMAVKDLTLNGAKYRYFDYAQPVRN